MQGNRREQIPLVRFCQLGDCENVQKLLKQARRCMLVVQLLLDHRSDVFLTHDQGFTPLHLAAAWGSVPTVGLLLAAGSDINALNRNRKTAADVGQSAEASLAIRDVSSQAPKLQ